MSLIEALWNSSPKCEGSATTSETVGQVVRGAESDLKEKGLERVGKSGVSQRTQGTMVQNGEERSRWN